MRGGRRAGGWRQHESRSAPGSDVAAPGPSPWGEHLDVVKGVPIVPMLYGHVVDRGSLAALRSDLTRDPGFHMQVLVVLSGHLLHDRIVPRRIHDTVAALGLAPSRLFGVARTLRPRPGPAG